MQDTVVPTKRKASDPPAEGPPKKKATVSSKLSTEEYNLDYNYNEQVTFLSSCFDHISPCLHANTQFSLAGEQEKSGMEIDELDLQTLSLVHIIQDNFVCG